MTDAHSPAGTRVDLPLDALTPPQAALMAYGERKRPRRRSSTPSQESSVAEICEHGAYLSTVGIGPLRKRGGLRLRWSWVKAASPVIVVLLVAAWVLETGSWEHWDVVAGTSALVVALLVKTLPRDGAMDLDVMAGRNAVMLTDTHLILRRPGSATTIPRHLVAGAVLTERMTRTGSRSVSDDDPRLSRSGDEATLALRFFDGPAVHEVVVASAVGDQTIVGFVGKGSAFDHLEAFRDVLQRWSDGVPVQDLAPGPDAP